MIGNIHSKREERNSSIEKGTVELKDTKLVDNKFVQFVTGSDFVLQLRIKALVRIGGVHTQQCVSHMGSIPYCDGLNRF